MRTIRTVVALVVLSGSLLPAATWCQESREPLDQGVVADEQILLKQVMTDKRSVFTNNLEMTASESAKFWPIYEEYEGKLKKLDDRFLELVNQYAGKYDTLSDADATAGLKEKMAIERERMDLKQAYTKKIAKVLPPKKALRYAQLETRIEILLRSQVYSLIPLAH
jgi:hypothetical protein